MERTEPWDIRGQDGQNVTERKLFVAMNSLGLHPVPQYKIERMTVDFAFPDQMLVVEINGKHHQEPACRDKDIRRWHVLKKLGWKVKNFSAKSAYYYPEKVAREVQQTLQQEHSPSVPFAVGDVHQAESYARRELTEEPGRSHFERREVTEEPETRHFEPREAPGDSARHHEAHTNHTSIDPDQSVSTIKGFVVCLLILFILFLVIGDFLKPKQSLQSTPTEITPSEIMQQNICDQEYLNSNGGANRRAMAQECSDKCSQMEPAGTMEYYDIDCMPPNEITCRCKSK